MCYLCREGQGRFRDASTPTCWGARCPFVLQKQSFRNTKRNTARRGGIWPPWTGEEKRSGVAFLIKWTFQPKTMCKKALNETHFL